MLTALGLSDYHGTGHFWHNARSAQYRIIVLHCFWEVRGTIDRVLQQRRANVGVHSLLEVGCYRYLNTVRRSEGVCVGISKQVEKRVLLVAKT